LSDFGVKISHIDADSTPFIDKMNQVCEMQVASQDYIPIVVNETIVRSMNTDEVKILEYFWVS